MKYLKHFFVDAVTGEAVTSAGMPPNGKTHPAIPGLDVKFWFSDNGVDYCMSMVDSTDEVAASGVSYLSQSSWMDAIEAEFVAHKQRRILETFEYTKQVKSGIVDVWWHPTEISAGVSIKVAQAKLALEEDDDYGASLVAPIIAMEATTRGIGVKNLAARIIGNYDNLVLAEAVISGHRGLITDNIELIPFDRTSVETASDSFNTLNNFDITQGFAGIMSQLGM